MVTDLRTVSFDVPPQEILTKDSVTVAVDAVIYYKISSPLSAVCNVSDYAKSTKLLASTTLRTILGTKNLSEILSDRESIAEDILANLDKATDPWGVKVERVEVKDVRLPQQLQRAVRICLHFSSSVILIEFVCQELTNLYFLDGRWSRSCSWSQG